MSKLLENLKHQKRQKCQKCQMIRSGLGDNELIISRKTVL